jgi:hypothetical protein
LAPADPRDVAKVVGRLFLSFPSQASSVEVQKAKIASYVEDLSGLPLWALEAAAAKWRRGEATGNATFAPSVAELRRQADAQTLQHRATIAKLKRILTAKERSGAERTPEARERVAAKFGDLINSLTKPEGPSA